MGAWPRSECEGEQYRISSSMNKRSTVMEMRNASIGGAGQSTSKVSFYFFFLSAFSNLS